MWLIIFVTIIFVAACGIIFLEPFNLSPQKIDAILPLATFALAYIAVLTILYSNLKDKKRRKLSSLMEIDDWAKNGHRILSGYLPKQTLQGRDDSLRLLAEINSRKTGMAKLARLFNNNLHEEVDKAVEDLDVFTAHLRGPIDDFTSDSFEFSNMEVLQENCDKSIIKVLDLTSMLRTKLKI